MQYEETLALAGSYRAYVIKRIIDRFFDEGGK